MFSRVIIPSVANAVVLIAMAIVRRISRSPLTSATHWIKIRDGTKDSNFSMKVGIRLGVLV